MTSPQAAKGAKWERDVVAYLRAVGVPANRPRQEGFDDVGDIHASPFVIQAKDHRDVMAAIRLATDAAPVQARAAREPFGVAVVKRARRPVGEAYAVMRLEDLAALIKKVRNDA